jgi:type VI secretion system secreted protein VgrG
MLHAPSALWFIFTVRASSTSGFSVYSFSGTEEVCKPYEFSVELVSRSANVDMTALLGAPACLSIVDKSGGTRLTHGLIRQMEQLHTANRFTHYRCLLVPRLWFLGQIRDQRIFRNLSVVEIIRKILHERGFPAEAYVFKLFFSYEPREYRVQYGETDLRFITRLCEEEGIHFYFEHTASSHTLCFSDREGGPKIPGESNLRFYPGSGALPDTAVISRLSLRSTVNTNAAMYREWNFQRPRLDLEVRDREPDGEKAPVPPGMNLEQYRYPHLYGLRDPCASRRIRSGGRARRTRSWPLPISSCPAPRASP